MNIFTKYNILAPQHTKKGGHLPLKEHMQIPFMIDTLSRQKNHHLLITKSSSEKIQNAIMEALANRLTMDTAPKALRDAYFIYLDVKRFMASAELLENIEHDFFSLCEDMRLNKKRMIFAINEMDPLLTNDQRNPAGLLGKLLKTVLFNEQWRIIALSQETNVTPMNDYFTSMELMEPSDADMLAIFKSYREELETFHQVVISDDTFTSAISMTHHYLAGDLNLDKAFELLDSAAARASFTATPDAAQKPLVTNMHLAQVVSSWTQIPLTHLQHNKFQATKFTEALNTFIFGQDHAIQIIGALLQNACIKLHKKPGTLCNLLLAGPMGVGKSTFAHAMAEHLFGHHNALLRLHHHESRLENMKVLTGGHKDYCMNLLTAIQKTPYAILLIENIEHLSMDIIAVFKEMLANGYIFDSFGKKYDFSNVIIIMTTTVVGDSLQPATQVSSEKSKKMDLLQLIMNEQVHDMSYHSHSSQEIRDEVTSALSRHFSTEFLNYFNIIPFVPLDFSALEKIIRIKLKGLSKRLETSFGIELHYAPEIIKFLAHEATWEQSANKSLDKMLEQKLYACVAHELVARFDDKQRPKLLSLQLNDNGQMLRCDIMTASEAALYNL